MRVTVSQPSTGLVYAPGLARQIVLDTDHLPTEISEQMLALAKQAQLFEKPQVEHAPASSQMRDARQFVVHIEDGQMQSTLHLSEPLNQLDDATEAFVRLVLQQADVSRAATK